MLNLAIECSGFHGSVAVVRDHELVAFASLPAQQSSVQSLAGTIATLLSSCNARPNYISVTNGPGSFTGLRVGLTTAKMLGFAWNIPVVPVDTLEVLAYQMIHRVPCEQSTVLIPVLNAFRQQVFTAAWRFETNETIMRLGPSQVVDAGAWIVHPLQSQILDDPAFDPRVPVVPGALERPLRLVIAGPGLKNYHPAIPEENSLAEVAIVDDLQPQADFVARLGQRLYQDGKFTTASQLQANYIRSSAAEEKLPKKGLASSSKCKPLSDNL